jgi:hypothetical protein
MNVSAVGNYHYWKEWKTKESNKNNSSPRRSWIKSVLGLNILLLQCDPTENIFMGSLRGKCSYLAKVTHMIPSLILFINSYQWRQKFFKVTHQVFTAVFWRSMIPSSSAKEEFSEKFKLQSAWTWRWRNYTPPKCYYYYLPA